MLPTGEVRLSGGTFEGNNRAITNANKLTLTNVTVKSGSGAAKMISIQQMN